MIRPGSRGGQRTEQGGIAAMTALLLVPMMILAAFSVDLGMAYAQAQAFSAGADSAALAIAKEQRAQLLANPALASTCTTLKASDLGKALATAKKQVDANRPFDLKATTGQVDVQVQLSCVDSSGNPSATGRLRSTVTVERNVPTTLGRLAGVTSVKASRSASAGVGVAGSVPKAFPLTICESQADWIMANALVAPYPIETIDVNKVWKSDCSDKSGSGNWGWVDCGGVSTVVLADAITNGCNKDLSLKGTPPTLTVDGTPGNKINAGPVRDALTGVKGKVFPFPVYDLISGTGSGTTYRIVGFINLRYIDSDKDGNIQVQYVSWSPLGTINPACGIGNPNCQPYNAYVIGLNS